jgi:hypothetical protein
VLISNKRYSHCGALFRYISKFVSFKLFQTFLNLLLTFLFYKTLNKVQLLFLLQVTILPPRDLLIPVLGVTIDEVGLQFTLCNQCSKEQRVFSSEACLHPPHLRQLFGSWCHTELAVAIARNYVVKIVHSAYVWDEWMQWFPGDPNEKGMFTSFIKHFYRLKCQANGYPNSCITEADKQQYVAQVEREEGIILDATKIAKNPGLKQVAKLLLNS